ncbi:hypothetical protein EDI_139470 [Entamoeba dispar SAW760]|uniref:Uncharacterized protein n=1 Tax=Entamoeba dispar (strain ATCC PRA-260 / SAW760) TaxID=370354 RepID=B0EN80_ENTDS|nr:uncharacterized protein EDI_139470 [Entamoeba dispar SAW760]EDR24024.1 hypothetical protein EDI_139470 [Entamoeba dispar SAW760]|eukprot:EDR24024.1 hypothetical protein EDI_139470 [Entamoeba dispar SAW760]
MTPIIIFYKTNSMIDFLPLFIKDNCFSVIKTTIINQIQSQFPENKINKTSIKFFIDGNQIQQEIIVKTNTFIYVTFSLLSEIIIENESSFKTNMFNNSVSSIKEESKSFSLFFTDIKPFYSSFHIEDDNSSSTFFKTIEPYYLYL